MGARSAKQEIDGNRRIIERVVVKLDREINQMQTRESNIIAGIKRAAKQNRLKDCRSQAKDLVRQRRTVSNLTELVTQLRATANKLLSVSATIDLQQSLKRASLAMKKVNNTMFSIPELSNIMNDFIHQNDRLEIKMDMIDRGLDNADANEEDEEEIEQTVGQILDELGLDISVDMPNAAVLKPSQNHHLHHQQHVEEEDEKQEEEEETGQLRRHH